MSDLSGTLEGVAKIGSLYDKEQSLYVPFQKTITEYYTRENAIEDLVCELTANQGARSTGGKWTRPDVTLVAVRMYPFIPGKTLAVITFELKPIDAYGIDGLYEAASHSSVANRAYLALHLKDGDTESEFLERFDREAERFGVGLFTFTDPANWETFEERVEAEHKTPDPAMMNDFIQSQIAPVNHRKLQKLIR